MWKLNTKPHTNAAPDKDAASVFFERMEPKILFSADAFSGLVSTDPFSDNASNSGGLNISESAGFLNEVYAPAANGTGDTPVTTETPSLQLDELKAVFEGTDAENDAATSLDTLETLLDGAGTQEQRQEIIFVDAATPDYQQLLDGMNTDSADTDYQIFILHSDHDGIEQITEILGGFEAVDAIHLVSHGNETGLQLGSSWLGQASLDDYADAVGSWSTALTEDADILIYGCNLAAASSGQQLIDSLAALTGADVAASDDLTGAAAQGGDWELEYTVGDVETSLAVDTVAQQNWSNLLAIITVTTTNDVINAVDGLTSLREAIIDANTLAGVDEIILGPGTYTLDLGSSGEDAANEGDLDILSEIIITGSDSATTIIDASGIVGGDRVFDLILGGSLTMSNVTVQGGDANSGGNGGRGGGFYVEAGGTLSLENVVVQNNSSVSDGGGIYNKSTVKLSEVTVTNNSVPGEGGGIYNVGAATSILDRVTFNGNTADTGGGIHNDGILNMTNATLSGNTASVDGGGIYNEGTMTLQNSTITLNSAITGVGGGIFANGTETISNNIIAGNSAVASNEISGTIDTSGGYNIIGDNAGDSVGGSGYDVNDILDTDPMLGPLQNNGGSTQTHQLLAGSPAIDPAGLSGAPAVDQRDFTRDATPDIGAYEFGASKNTANAVNDSYATDADTILTVAANGVLANDSSSIATPGATLEYIAQQDTDGNNVWEDTTGVAGYDFDFAGSDVVYDDSLSNAQAGISAAYVFGSGAAVTPNLGISPDLFADLPGNPTDAAASFEFWIRPTDASGTEIIFDVGVGVDGSGNEGASLRLNGSTLEWLVWDDGGTANAFATQDISAEIASGKFIQVVATFDPNDPAATVSLSINGGPAATGFNANVNDWESPGESPAIGDNDGFTRILNPTPGADFFRGEIAAFRFYESVLSAAEIQQNFDSMYFNVIAHDPTSALGATVVVNADGSFSYDPGGLFDSLPAGTAVVDTFSYTIEDSNSGQDTATVSVIVNGVNDAPNASNLSSTSSYNEGDASVPITDIVVSDIDTGETITATLTLADTATGSLSANDGATYDGLTGIWTITDTVANVNTALANLVFNPTVNNDIDTTIDVSIDDGDEDGSGALTGTITLDVTPINDPPTATNLSSTSAYNEGDASVAITDIVVSDVDTGEIITATLTLADTGTGSLSANDGATYDGLTGIWTITDTVANVNTALANLVFNPAVNNEVDTTIGVSIDDGDEDGSGALTGTITLDVTPINDPPTATNLSSTSAYNEGDASVPITDIVVSDVDTGEIITATLTLADTATGSLSANDGATYDGLTGIWTITDTVANVNTALANLVFNPAVNNEVDTTIGVSIDDGDEDNSGALTGIIDLDVTPVNDPPVLGNNNLIVDEGAIVTITTAMFSATDIDNPDPGLIFNLSAVSGGQFELTTNPGVAVFSFTQGQILLNEVIFIDDGDETPPAFNISVSDGTDASPVVAGGFTFTNTNDAPTATNLSSTSSYNEGDASVPITNIVVSDVDAGDLITATLTLADTSTGSLSANNGATYDGLTGIWTITGTVAQVNNALANLVFVPLINNSLDTSIDVNIDDGDEDNSGPLSGTITLDVTPINDPPTATNLNSTSSYTEGDASVPITDIVVSDIDAGDIITATLTLADTATGSLSANNGASYDGLTGIWTITDTVANVNTALANLVFNPTVNNEVDTTIAVSIDDGDEDGSGALTGIIDLDVTPVNDAPTASNLSSTSSYDEGDASVALNDIVISDVDSGETVTATLVLANVSTGSLSANDGATYNATTGVWTITGSVAQVNTALANLQFLPVASNTLDTTIAVSIDDGDEDSSGPLIGAMTITVNPLPVVEPPVVEPPVVEPPVDEDPPDEPAEDPVEEPPTDLPAGAPELPVSDPVLIPSRIASAPSLLPGLGVEPEAASVRDYDNNDENNEVREAPTLKPAGVDTLITRLTEQLDFFDDPLQLIGAESFITRLNDMREELISETENTEKVIGSSLSVTAGLSVGYVVWLARSGVLLSSVLSSLPAWRFIDPLPVLGGLQGSKEGDDEESLESLVEKNEADDKSAEPEGGNHND